MSIIYDIVFIVFLFFYAPLSFFRKKKRKGLRMRLGIYSKKLLKNLAGRKNVWIHAVSVGEVMAVKPLAEKIRQRCPGVRIVITTITETGNAAVNSIIKEGDIALYLPFDIGFVVRRVMSYIKPVFLIVAETEIWPNLFFTAYENNVKIFLVNGRISDNSYSRYRLLTFLLKPILSKAACFCMQSKEHAQRIISIGALKEKVFVTGNMKFDSGFLPNNGNSASEGLIKIFNSKSKVRIITAGSTHPGEEPLILDAYIRLRDEFPGLRLVIAPRHIERADKIAQLVKCLSLKPVLFSFLTERGSALSSEEVLILDTIGTLKAFYGISELVFIGGSLVKKGGQNVIEPALFNKPVITGPYTNNFHDIVNMFLANDAIVIARSGEELMREFKRLLASPDAAKMIGKRAGAVVESNKGSAERVIRIIEHEGVFS
jgi:3-deoxy-D-manno-octulosonic-acid transferase